MTAIMRAADALLRHGDYLVEGHSDPEFPAQPDALEWLHHEATDVAACTTADEVVAVLVDTAWFDPTDESDARARRVAEDLGLS